MKLFFLINGNFEKIAKNNGIDTRGITLVKIDEKKLARPKNLVPHLRKPFDEVIFGCIDIDYQRFLPFLHIYLLFARKKKGKIVDEFGKCISISVFKTIFWVIPRLFLEALFSIVIVVFSYIYYWIWWKSLAKD